MCSRVTLQPHQASFGPRLCQAHSYLRTTPPEVVLSRCVALLTPSQSFQSQLKFPRLYPYSYLITLFPSKYFSVWREQVFPCVFCLSAPLGCRHHRAGISVPMPAVSRFLTETWPGRDAHVKFVPSVFLLTVPVSNRCLWDYQRPVFWSSWSF